MPSRCVIMCTWMHGNVDLDGRRSEGLWSLFDYDISCQMQLHGKKSLNLFSFCLSLTSVFLSISFLVPLRLCLSIYLSI